MDDTPRVWITYVLRPQPRKNAPASVMMRNTGCTRPSGRGCSNERKVDGLPGLMGRAGQRLHAMRERADKAICLLDARMRTLTAEPEEGAATAEYAVVLVAATGFAAVLVGIMKSDAIKTLLTNIIKKALSVG